MCHVEYGDHIRIICLCLEYGLLLCAKYENYIGLHAVIHTRLVLARFSPGPRYLMLAITKATPERAARIVGSLSNVKSRIHAAHSADHRAPVLVAVSKYQPVSDILACYEIGGHLDFGENYVQELVEKAATVRFLIVDAARSFTETLSATNRHTLALHRHFAI